MTRALLLALALTCWASEAQAQIGTPTCATETGNLLGDGSEVTSFLSPTTAGQPIVVLVQANDAGRLVTSITDNVSNTYEEAVFATAAAGISAIWWCDDCASAQDITTTIDGNSDGIDRLTVCTFSGGAADMTPVSNESSTASVTSHPTGTVLTTAAHSILFGLNTCGTGSYTADGTFTQIVTGANHMVAYRILTSTATVGMTTTSLASETCTNVLAGLDGATGGGGGGGGRKRMMGLLP